MVHRVTARISFWRERLPSAFMIATARVMRDNRCQERSKSGSSTRLSSNATTLK